MLQLPKKTPENAKCANNITDNLKYTMMSYYEEEVLKETPEHVKIGIDRHFESVVSEMDQKLLLLKQEYERKVSDLYYCTGSDLNTFARTGNILLQSVQTAIADMIASKNNTCAVTFRPELGRPLNSDVELQTNLETWKVRFPHWAKHIDLVTAHFTCLGYNVKFTYNAPSKVSYYKGDDGVRDGIAIDPSWTYHDFGSVTMSIF